VTREVEFLSNDYTNPNTNPKTLMTLALTLADHHGDFESFCAPVFCDFIRNYSCTVDGAVVTSYIYRIVSFNINVYRSQNEYKQSRNEFNFQTLTDAG